MIQIDMLRRKYYDISIRIMYYDTKSCQHFDTSILLHCLLLQTFLQTLVLAGTHLYIEHSCAYNAIFIMQVLLKVKATCKDFHDGVLALLLL